MFKVGDKVRVKIGNGWNRRFDAGDEFIVLRVERRDIGLQRVWINDHEGHVEHRWCNHTRFELVEEAVPVAPVRRDINKDLRVGDRVVAIRAFIVLNNEVMKKGDVAVVSKINELRGPDRIYFSVEGGVGGCSTTCWELEENYLADNAPKEAPMTRFVFSSRGGKYYEKGDFNSLEAATTHAKTLRRRFFNGDIHPFVIVED